MAMNKTNLKKCNQNSGSLDYHWRLKKSVTTVAALLYQWHREG